MSELSQLLRNQYARIAKLEAENAELKRAHESQLKANVDLYRAIDDVMPTREQIAALVKPLEWDKETAKTYYGVYNLNCNIFSDVHWFALMDKSANVIYEPECHYKTESEARAAAEAHHKETVLNLLNLPA